jgi:hypothetical protein
MIPVRDCWRRAVNKREVVLELDLRNVRERVWDPRRRSGREAGGIASTETFSQQGHDRPRERTRCSFRHSHAMVDGPKPRPLSGFFLLVSWSQPRSGSSSDLS